MSVRHRQRDLRIYDNKATLKRITTMEKVSEFKKDQTSR